MSNDSNSGCGLFTSMLAVLFIALKLCGVISWSWVWVLAPLWIPVLAAFMIMIPAAIFFKLKSDE